MSALYHTPSSTSCWKYPPLLDKTTIKVSYNDNNSSVAYAIITYILIVLECCTVPNDLCTLEHTLTRTEEIKESSIKLIYDLFKELNSKAKKLYWRTLIILLHNTEKNIYRRITIPEELFKKIDDNIYLFMDANDEETFYKKIYDLLGYNIIYKCFNIIIHKEQLLKILKFDITFFNSSEVSEVFINTLSFIQEQHDYIESEECYNKNKTICNLIRHTKYLFDKITISLFGFGTCITNKGIDEIYNITNKNWNNLSLVLLGCGEPQPLSTAWRLCNYIETSFFVDIGDDTGRYYKEKDFLTDKYPGKFYKMDSSEFIKNELDVNSTDLIVSISWPECPQSNQDTYETLDEHISYWSIKAFNDLCEVAKTTEYNIWILFTGLDDAAQQPGWYEIFRQISYWEINSKRIRQHIHDNIFIFNIKEYLNILNPVKKK